MRWSVVAGAGLIATMLTACAPRAEEQPGDSALTGAGASALPRPADSGAAAETPVVAMPPPVVRDAQRALARIGYNPGPANGLMGQDTMDALRAFQRSNDLPETGQLDARTRRALADGSGSGGGAR